MAEDDRLELVNHVLDADVLVTGGSEELAISVLLETSLLARPSLLVPAILAAASHTQGWRSTAPRSS
ncbi:MAG: hypothetical protein ABIO67_09685 [Mycobacteriales bacterium]